MIGIEGEFEVGHHWVAFVAAGGEEDRGPEILEGGEVMGPVVDDGVEDGADVGVEPDLGVEAVDQVADLGFCDLLIWVHRISDVAAMTRVPPSPSEML